MDSFLRFVSSSLSSDDEICFSAKDCRNLHSRFVRRAILGPPRERGGGEGRGASLNSPLVVCLAKTLSRSPYPRMETRECGERIYSGELADQNLKEILPRGQI